MSSDVQPTTNRKQLARERAEQALKDAALELLGRDGLLAGLNLQEVADAAAVNRGLIHRWFRTRRALLRAAMHSQQERLTPDVLESLDRPLAKRTAWAVQQYAVDPTYAQMIMLLALDGDDEFEPIPYLTARLETFRDEIARGMWSNDVDPLALTLLWDTILAAYFTLRDGLARQTGVARAELDQRIFTTVGRLYAGLLEPTTEGDAATTRTGRRAR